MTEPAKNKPAKIYPGKDGKPRKFSDLSPTDKQKVDTLALAEVVGELKQIYQMSCQAGVNDLGEIRDKLLLGNEKVMALRKKVLETMPCLDGVKISEDVKYGLSTQSLPYKKLSAITTGEKGVCLR